MAKILKRVKRTPGEAKASDHWRTPRDCFEALDREFDFAIDLAADRTSTLCTRWLGPGSVDGEDALAVQWSALDGPGFLNPPYSSALIKAFLEKAVHEAHAGFTTVALVPYTPDTEWWRLTARAAEIRDIPHRVPYLRADGVTKAGAMFPSAIVVFRWQPGCIRPQPRRVTWTWREDKFKALRGDVA